MLVERARQDGLALTGQGGLLQQLTQRVLESALEGEITDHVAVLRRSLESALLGGGRVDLLSSWVLAGAQLLGEDDPAHGVGVLPGVDEPQGGLAQAFAALVVLGGVGTHHSGL